MPTFAQLVYLILCILVIYAELSTHINTNNLFKKTGLAMIALGALFGYKGHPLLIAIGMIVFLIPNAFNHFISQRKRRATDL